MEWVHYSILACRAVAAAAASGGPPVQQQQVQQQLTTLREPATLRGDADVLLDCRAPVVEAILAWAARVSGSSLKDPVAAAATASDGGASGSGGGGQQ
jgi:hypothetical protein